MVYVKVLCFLSTSKLEETSVLLLIQCESVVAELAVLARQQKGHCSGQVKC